ncbi:MAG: endo-1,3-alpha-glucanase family glycosylhydrolase [Anaerolineae bacterium]
MLCLVFVVRSMPIRAQERAQDWAQQSVQSGERLVLAFYYAWFDMLTWEKPLPDKPLQLYHSSDVYVIQRHAREAREAGIDALVQAWYGPDMTNNQTESNFRILLEQAQAQGIRAAVSVDMGGPFLQTEDAVLDALQALREGRAQHSAYLRVDGRPVVFFWRQDQFSVATWQAIRAQVDPERQMLWIAEGVQLDYIEVFDGLYLYSVAWSATPASVLVRWGSTVDQWNAQHNATRYWVATVMPGYDDLATGRPDAFVRPREGGAYYRACWQGAAQSDADWVVITSFNEWLEATHIEPSTQYGDSYIGLTAELAAAYRSASLAVQPTPTPELPTATPEVVPTATITPTVTPIPATPTLTATLALTFTATPTPTVTPFRLSTPTPRVVVIPPAASPTPYSVAPAATSAATPTLPPRTLMPVEGVPSKTCGSAPVLLLALGFVVVLLRRR